MTIGGLSVFSADCGSYDVLWCYDAACNTDKRASLQYMHPSHTQTLLEGKIQVSRLVTTVPHDHEIY